PARRGRGQAHLRGVRRALAAHQDSAAHHLRDRRGGDRARGVPSRGADLAAPRRRARVPRVARAARRGYLAVLAPEAGADLAPDDVPDGGCGVDVVAGATTSMNLPSWLNVFQVPSRTK